MSDTTLQPDEGVAADQGHQPSTDERLSAVSREVLESVESGDEDTTLQAEETEVAEEEVGEPSAEEAEPEGDETGDEAEDPLEAGESESQEDESDSVQETQTWDGNPDNIPDEHRPYYDHWVGLANKGLQKRLRQMAATEKEYKDATFRYEQAMVDMRGNPEGASPKENGPPTPPTGENLTQEDWAKHEAKVAEYHDNRLNAETRQSVAAIKERQDMSDRLQMIAAQDGATEDVMFRMRDMAEADVKYQDMFQSDEGALHFFEQAKLAVEREAFEAEKKSNDTKLAKAAEADAKRKAGAAKRATPRPGGTKAASAPEEVFARKAFKSTDEKLTYLRNQVLEENGL